jgi:hypothetical protein
MRTLRGMCSAAVAVVLVPGLANLHGQNKQPLALVQTIPIPNVKGRLDHLWVDVGSKRLFVAGLENGSLEIIDSEVSQVAEDDNWLSETTGDSVHPWPEQALRGQRR